MQKKFSQVYNFPIEDVDEDEDEDEDVDEDVDEDAKRYAASCHNHHLLVIVRMGMRVNSEWTLSILTIYICELCKLQVGELRKLATFIKIPGKCYLGEK